MTTKNLAKELDKITSAPLTLGIILNSIRLCDEITLEDFADKLCISSSYLNDIEQGNKTVSNAHAFEFAKKLGYPESDFMRYALQDDANGTTI